MNSEYLNELTTLLRTVRPELVATQRLTFKNVFGAVAGYWDDRIFISCGVFGVALRLPPDTLGDLFKVNGVKRLKYFQNGHVKKEYAILPNEILRDRRQCGRLLDESIAWRG
jgi:hypothetical protein